MSQGKRYKNTKTYKLWKRVNDRLAMWDPIGVGQEIASDEYTSYIPDIVKAMPNRGNVKRCLENMLDHMGLGYESSNPIHCRDLEKVCDDLLKLVPAK